MITQVWHVSCGIGVTIVDQGKKMYRKWMWAAAAILAVAPLEAEAATLAFHFETDDAAFVVSGDLTVSDALNAVGGYDVTGIAGTVAGANGGPITGLIANPNQPGPTTDNTNSWLYDNVAYTSGPSLDDDGLLFTAGGGASSYIYNLFFDGSFYQLSSRNPGGNYYGETGQVAMWAVPEPSTWLMMGLGFAALGLSGARTARRESRTAFA